MRRHWPIRPPGFAAVLAVVFALGCASAPQPPPPNRISEYRVGTPDVLQISILPEPRIERSVVVRPDGKISMDLAGDVQAAGRTVREISAELQEKISRYRRSPHVTVLLTTSRSRAITILGEVERPATFALEKDTRIAEALGKVSGPTQRAARSRIRVVRYGSDTTRIVDVDLEAIEDGDMRTNIFLEGGDIVVVPPTVVASIGYAIGNALFPFAQIFGFGARTISVVGSF